MGHRVFRPGPMAALAAAIALTGGASATAAAQESTCYKTFQSPNHQVEIQTCEYDTGKSGFITKRNLTQGPVDVCWTLNFDNGKTSSGCHSDLAAGAESSSSCFSCNRKNTGGVNTITWGRGKSSGEGDEARAPGGESSKKESKEVAALKPQIAAIIQTIVPQLHNSGYTYNNAYGKMMHRYWGEMEPDTSDPCKMTLKGRHVSARTPGKTVIQCEVTLDLREYDDDVDCEAGAGYQLEFGGGSATTRTDLRGRSRPSPCYIGIGADDSDEETCESIAKRFYKAKSLCERLKRAEKKATKK